MKKYFILLLVLFISSCSEYKKVEKVSSGNVIETEVPEPTEKIETVQIVEVGEDNKLVQVKNFTGFNDKQKENFWVYATKLNQTVNSQCYENYISNFENYNKNKLPILRTKGLSRSELVIAMRGEKPILRFELYESNNSTIGYTYPTSDKIWFNWKFHKNYTYCQSAANLGHEISHKLDFGHDYNNTATRWRQFPYAHGSAISYCCPKLSTVVEAPKPITINPTTPAPKKVQYCYRSWRNIRWNNWFGKVCYWKTL